MPATLHPLASRLVHACGMPDIVPDLVFNLDPLAAVFLLPISLLSMLAAVPKGSGLGTSSILAATVLGTLSELLGLGWSQQDLVARTLALEQMHQVAVAISEHLELDVPGAFDVALEHQAVIAEGVSGFAPGGGP